MKSVGGFRLQSSNYIGEEATDNLIYVFKEEGYVLSKDGSLNRAILDNLNVVCALEGDKIWMITAYYPSKNQWLDDLKTRRR